MTAYPTLFVCVCSIELAPAKAKPSAAAAPTNATTKIDGKIKLNGVFYQTKCDCKQINLDGESAEAAARRNQTCANPPNRIRVRQELIFPWFSLLFLFFFFCWCVSCKVPGIAMRMSAR